MALIIFFIFLLIPLYFVKSEIIIDQNSSCDICSGTKDDPYRDIWHALSSVDDPFALLTFVFVCNQNPYSFEYYLTVYPLNVKLVGNCT